MHVEHIYPKTPQAGAELAEHASVVSRIGNLTLLSARLNVAIRNGTYAEKCDAYGDSHLLLTNGLPEQYEIWNADTITARQTELAALAADIWSFPVAG